VRIDENNIILDLLDTQLFPKILYLSVITSPTDNWAELVYTLIHLIGKYAYKRTHGLKPAASITKISNADHHENATMSSPRPTPSITFNPALYLQRQTFLLETLRVLQPKSVLDIGCGEGRLLECLVRCDEALPVEILAGLDVSLSTLQQASSSIISAGNDQQADGRWRSLNVTLLHGIP
jgi:2-polyprenyl-3-methyl-5-hydroxy-6-metoxy-1,4-benzoquinol methylase